MHSKLIIIGAHGHGKVAADVAIKMNKWESIAFLDDNTTIKSTLGLPVIGIVSDAEKFKDEADFFVAIGNNKVRENYLEKMINDNYTIATLVHPSSVIGIEVTIGVGTIVMAGVVINSSTIIGQGCIVNTNASIDHDNYINDFVHISPRVVTAGNVVVGQKTWLGVGSSVSNNVSICSSCIVGAGAVVLKDITETGTYAGVPVRRTDK